MNSLKFFAVLLMGIGVGLCGINAQDDIPSRLGNHEDLNKSGRPDMQILASEDAGRKSSSGKKEDLKISVVNGLEEATRIHLFVRSDRGPSSDLLSLTTSTTAKVTFFFKLCDVNDIVLITRKINSDETNIMLDDVNAGTYFLKVIAIWRYGSVLERKEEVKVFKIIKT